MGTLEQVSPATMDAIIENRTFDELEVGMRAELTRVLRREDIELFAVMSGDVNPAHLDDTYAAETRFHQVIGHGLWSGALVSTVLGTKLPGPGTIYLGQELRFHRPVTVGDTLNVAVTVREKQPEKKIVVFDCVALNQHGETVMSGVATVIAPVQKVRREPMPLPEVNLQRLDLFDGLIARCAELEPTPCAVVHPCDRDSLRGAVTAAEMGLIRPVLVGPEHRIRAVAEEEGIDLSSWQIEAVEHSHAAAARSVELARNGLVQAIMKGSLHTDELMSEIVAPHGLRTARRVSHAFLMDIPAYERPLIISDAAINIHPDLDVKRDIVQNAIELAHVIGIERPKVAILSAVETVTTRIPSTIEAAALCKMADRGQITGAELDGPLAFDNAISLEAARTKGIRSGVAGRADVLITPDLESGNMLAKQLTYFAGADNAGVVLGARVPVVLTSRADSVRARLASAALVALIVAARQPRPAPAPVAG